VLLLAPVALALVGGPLAGLGSSSAGADTSLLGYNASALAIGSQFTFNVPGVVPLPNENLIEEDAPFARTTVGAGPVVDALGAPYYPGDIAANLGSLLLEFGAPNLPVNDPLLAESKFPTSPGFPSQASFGIQPSQSKPTSPSIFSSSADSSDTGGDATGTLTDVSLDNLSALTPVTNALSGALGGVTGPLGGGSGSSGSSAQSLIDVGNISSTNKVTLGANAITSTATATVGSIDVAGLVDIAGLVSTATAKSDGTTGTPTATVHFGQVTVDGQQAYIDDTGVHVASTGAPSASITPAQLQQTVDTTLAQDGVTIKLLDPENTSQGAQASADAGGLSIAISHQLDVPFVPGEPTIPVPELGNVGLPAGVYTATTSITFGLAQASVNASGLSTGNTGNSGAGASTSPPTTLGSTGNSGNTGFGSATLATGSLLSGLGATPATAPTTGAPTAPVVSAATSFPIRGIPPPLGWSVVALLACILFAYPLLLLARWQFSGSRRS
jgi:hypothetical protein